MRKEKIAGPGNSFLISSNDYDDDNCPVCVLMKKDIKEKRQTTAEDLAQAMHEANMLTKK